MALRKPDLIETPKTSCQPRRQKQKQAISKGISQAEHEYLKIIPPNQRSSYSPALRVYWTCSCILLIVMIIIYAFHLIQNPSWRSTPSNTYLIID